MAKKTHRLLYKKFYITYYPYSFIVQENYGCIGKDFPTLKEAKDWINQRLDDRLFMVR